jgi:hypothetical protein
MEQQPNQLDPSHELPAGNDDDIMSGSLYEQIKAEREAQAAAEQAAAEQQAIIDAAREEAERSPRLSQEERRLYRGIARAANVAELPEGVSDEDRRAATPLFSNRVTAEGNLDRMKQEAVEKLRADKRDRRQEERARARREAREKAEQEAKEQQEREAKEAERQAEEAARQAKLDAEADRVRKESRAAVSEEDKMKLVDEQVERDMSTKHAGLGEGASNMLRANLRERYAREADAHLDEMADQAAQRRVAYINANGGADAIESIRAKEAEQAEVRRQQEAAAAAAAEEEAKRQAFLDRLHNRGGNREAIREANEGQTGANETQSVYLSANERARLESIVRAGSPDDLPEGLSREERRSVANVVVGRAQASMNFDRMRADAQARLNEDRDSREALIARSQSEGIDGFTDEEIAALPAEAMDGMNDETRNAYFARLHQVMGSQPRERGDRNLTGVQSFAGEASELGADLAHQRSLFPGQAPAPDPNRAPVAPNSDSEAERQARERRFSDLFELEDQDRDEWRRQVDALSDEDRDAYFQYGMDRLRREAQRPGPDWDNPTPVNPMPPVRPRHDPSAPAPFPTPQPTPRAPRRRRLFGGADPSAPMPTPANAGQVPVDPSEVAPVNPNPLPNHSRKWYQVAVDWWPGRSRVSYQPHTRPSILRGLGRGLGKVKDSLTTRPEMSDEERAQAEDYINERDRRDAEEQRAAPQPPAPATRPVVNRPRAGSRPRRPAPRPQGYDALDDL